VYVYLNTQGDLKFLRNGHPRHPGIIYPVHFTLTFQKKVRKKDLVAVYKGETEVFLNRAMSLIVRFRKSEYSSLDAVNKAVKRFLTSFF